MTYLVFFDLISWLKPNIMTMINLLYSCVCINTYTFMHTHTHTEPCILGLWVSGAVLVICKLTTWSTSDNFSSLVQCKSVAQDLFTLYDCHMRVSQFATKGQIMECQRIPYRLCKTLTFFHIIPYAQITLSYL